MNPDKQKQVSVTLTLEQWKLVILAVKAQANDNYHLTPLVSGDEWQAAEEINHQTKAFPLEDKARGR